MTNRNNELKVLLSLKDELTGAMGKAAGGFQKHSKAIGLAATGMSLAIGGMAAVTIRAAADAEEATSKFAVTFGGETEKVTKILDAHAKAVGRSRGELKSLAADTGAVVKAMGFQESTAASLSVELTKLAVDVGSFTNANEADVLKAFTSALTGERESLKTYGIVINEAMVQQQALNMGLAETASQLTANDKAMATYQLLLQKTKDSQGDAARTSGSFTNQLRAFQGSLKDIQVLIGQQLLPLLTPLLTRITEITRGVLEWMDNNKGLLGQFGKWALAVGAVLAVLGPLLLILPQLVIGIKLVSTALMFLALNPIGAVISAIAILVVAFSTNMFGIRDKAMVVINSLIDGFNSLAGWLRPAFERVQDLFNSKLGWILPGGVFIKAILFLRKNWREVFTFLGSFFESFVNFFIRQARTILKTVDTVAGAFGKDSNLAASLQEIEVDWESMADKAAEVVGGMVDKVKGMVSSIKDSLLGAGGMEEDLEKGETAWDHFKTAVEEDTKAATKAVQEMVLGIHALRPPSIDTLIPDAGIGGGIGPSILQGGVLGQLQPEALKNRVANVIAGLVPFKETLDGANNGVLTMGENAAFVAHQLDKLADATQAETDAKERARQFEINSQLAASNAFINANLLQRDSTGTRSANLLQQIAAGRPTGPVGVGALEAAFGTGARQGTNFENGRQEFISLPGGERINFTRVEGEITVEGESLSSLIGRASSQDQ